MQVDEAFYRTKEVMLKYGFEVIYRGCPRHVIDQSKGPKEGAYIAGQHIVITGPVWEDTVMIHECCHSLQRPAVIPKNYYEDPTVYYNCEFEREAFLVERIVKGIM